MMSSCVHMSERLHFPEIPLLLNTHRDKLPLLYCLIDDSDRFRSREFIGTGEKELEVSGCVKWYMHVQERERDEGLFWFTCWHVSDTYSLVQ